MSLLEKRRKADMASQPTTQPTVTQPKSKLYEPITTTYQENLFQPAKQENWYKGDSPTGREIMGRIGQISKYSPTEAQNLYQSYKYLQNDVTSQYYNPYTKPTNPAVDNLKAMGIDTSTIDDKWFDANSWLKNYYTFSGTTTTPTKPGAKASAEQKAAYEYYQLANSEEATKKAETQWKALREELKYWANRKDLNLSDDEISSRIDWSKYKTLTDMEDAAKLGTPMELNRAVNFSRDNMYAVLWADRNDGGTGDMDMDLLNSAMGTGNQWKKNQEISDRLDPESSRYNPYAVGSTLKQEGLYFNRDSFDQKWLDDNRGILSGNDETAIKMYQAVYAAEQKTQKLEAEKEALDKALNRKLANATDPEAVMKWLDRMLSTGDYSALKSMDESLGSTKLLDTTRAIEYSRGDYEHMITVACEANRRKMTGDAMMEYMNSSVGAPPVRETAAAEKQQPDNRGKIGDIASAGARLPAAMSGTPEQQEIARANDAKLQEGIGIIMDDMAAVGVTPAEEAVMRNAGSYNFRVTSQYLKAVKGTKLDPWDRFGQELIKKSAGKTSSAVLENSDTIAAYELAQKRVDGLHEQLDAAKTQINEKVLAGLDLSAEDLDFYGKELPESIRTTVDIDGVPVELQLFYDTNLTHKFYLYNDWEVDENDPAVQTALNEANRKREAAVATQNLTEEQKADVEHYKALEAEVMQNDDFLRDGKADYDEAVQKTNDAKEFRNATVRLLTKVGADVSKIEDTEAVTNFLTDFMQYEPTEWNAYDTYYDFARRMTGKSGSAEFSDQVFAEAKASDEQVMQALEVAQWTLDYADREGIVMPDDVRNNLERYIGKLQRTHQDFEHLSYLTDPDFQKRVAEGKEIEARSVDWNVGKSPDEQPLWDVLSEEQQAEIQDMWATSEVNAANQYEFYAAETQRNGLFGLYKVENLLTDVEDDTWYYLLATKGAKAAQDYYAYLTDPDYGVLTNRSGEYTQNVAQDVTDSGLGGFAVANGLSFLLAPVASIGSALYAADYAMRAANGQNPEINPNSPYLTANIFRNATRAESAERIDETFKNVPVIKSLAQGGYEILTNRLDSMMNAVTFGSIFPWMNSVSNEMLQEFLGAAPMGMTAAMDAAAEAKRKGATDEQAAGVAGVTFLAETVTEAISLDNIKKAFGTGQDISVKTMQDFLTQWLTESGLSEMAGESINDIVEGTADYLIMGKLSDFEQNVQQYIDDGMSPEDAHAAAVRDAIGSVLHTALISYLSPGLDAISFGAGRFAAYRRQTMAYQRAGYNVSVLDVMRMEKEGRRERRNRPMPTEGETRRTQAPASEKRTAAPAPEKQTARGFEDAQRLAQEEENRQRQADEDAVRDWEILETAKDADSSVQSSSLAAVLDIGNTEESSDAASAAAVGLWQLFGNGSGNFLLNAMRNSLGQYDLSTPVQRIQQFIVGANDAGVNPSVVKEAVQNAVLGGTDSAAYQAVTSMGQHVTPADQARILAGTVETDNANPAVQQRKQQAIHEWRVAEAEKTAIVNGALDSVQAEQDAADAASRNADEARQQYEERQADLEAKGQNLQTANEEFMQDPGNNVKADLVNHALAEMTKSSEVEREYQQKLSNAQAAKQNADQKLKRVKENAMKIIRQGAEQQVAQEDQQRAVAAQQAAEMERQQAEEAAAAQVEADENENETIMDAEAFVNRMIPDATPEQREDIMRIFREEKEKLQQEEAEQAPPAQTPEQQAAQKDERAQKRRDRFIKQVGQKFGLDIRVLDTTNGGKVNRQNGYFIEGTNIIVLDKKTTQDDMMYKILTHELTHMAEESGTYDALSGVLVRMKYGGDSEKLAADIRAKKAQYDKALAEMHQQDNSINGDPISPEDASKEIVADLMGDLFLKDPALIDRFVKEDPGVARRFLESLKSFLKKALGMKGAWVSQTQQTVDMLEAALKDATANQTKERKYHLSEADAQSIQDSYPSSAVKVQTNHTYEQLQTVESYLGAVNNEVLEAAKTYYGDKNAPFKRINVANVSEREAADLNKLFGINVAGYRHDVDRNFFNHTEYRHGVNGKQDHTMADLNDVARVGWVIENYDSLTWNGDVSYEYLDDNQKPMPKIQYSKAVDGTIYVVEAVGENKWGKLHLLSAYMEKNNPTKYSLSDDTVTRMTDAKPQSNVQSAYASPVVESVAHDEQTVKPLVTDNNGNEFATEFSGGTVAVNTGIKFSLNSFNKDEQERTRQALLNVRDSNGKRLYTPEQVDHYMDDALGLASMIAADKARLDFKASDNQVFLKKNNDYYFTLDASTLCAKRLLYQGTFDYVQHALPDEVFTPEDLIDLVNIMNDMGYETPCGICYVESRRRWLDTYAQQFLDTLPEEGRPSIDDLTTTDGLEKLRHDDPEMYKAFVAAMNAKGSANPKVVQLRTEYRGDIGKLTDKDIQKVKDIGGLRIQSFSDFETPHLLDMVQAVLDMSAKRLTSQAYTKVPNFAWVFGDTGIKINLSLIGKGTGLDENGNLMFDNKEGMNFDEAMRLRDRYSKNVGTILVGINDDHIIAAMADPRIDFIIPFHKSGWSQEELRKMPTLNNYSDYTATQNERIIVGERENKVKSIKNMGQKALDNWIAKEGENHPGYQVTRQENGKFTVSYKNGYKTESFQKHKERTKEDLVNLEPVGAHAYWDFSKTGEENARNYLRMCAEQGRIPKFEQFLVDNGDGSFSLPEGDDKRSTAIRKGYWKTLIDFKMYDNDGNGAAQTEVTPNINMAQAQRVLNEHQLGRQMPDRSDGTKGRFIPMESNNSVPVAIPAAEEYIELIKRKRAGNNNPAGPLDSLEADLPIDVASLGKSQFHSDENIGVNQNSTVFGATQAPSTLGNAQNEQEEDYADGQQTAMAIDAETGETVRRIFSLPVEDKETLDFLNEQEKRGDVTVTYRTMKLLDGKLVSPKATFINGKVEGDTKLGQWEAAAEHPELVKFDENNGEAYFELEEKGRKTRARYNPYMHSSNLMLNDQFKGAYQYSGDDKKLGQFVTVECIVPNSEATSGYQAQYAKDPVGWTNWKAGGVAQKVEQNGGESRRVFLSRWIKPVRIVPDSEVAQHYKKLLGDSGIEVPANVVTPGLLSELEKAGVKIGAPEKQAAGKFRKMFGTKYSLPSDAAYMDAVERGDMDEAQRMADAKAAEEGYNIKVYHGTANSGRFNIFDPKKLNNSKMSSHIGQGFYFTNSEAGAREYTSQFDVYGNKKPGKNPYLFKGYLKLQNPIEVTQSSRNLSRSTIRNIVADGNNEWFFKSGLAHELQNMEINGEKHTKDEIAAMSRDEKIDLYTDYLARYGDMAALQHFVDAYKYDSQGMLLESMKAHTGCDGIHWHMRDGLDQFVAFDSSQFKDSDAVTYDDNGNAIPLSERFNAKQPDIRYSLPSDAPYLSAVERGEMDEAQRLVDEAAKEAGYTFVGYHGTKQPTLRYDSLGFGDETDYQNKRLPFTVFRAGQSGGIYVATNREVSEGFARNFNGDPGTVMSLYVRFQNPLVVNEHVWTSVPRYYNIPTPTIMKEAGYTQDTVGTEEISLFAQERGYDGVIIEGIREGTDTQTDDYIAFSPEQIKLADPVTYDDQGNVIPLSERFNTKEQDIRYSLPSEDLLRQVIRQYLRDGGSLALNTLDAYARPLEGNNPEATSSVGDKQRQFGSRTLQRSDEINAKVKQWVKDRSAYIPDTNAAQLDRAIAWVRSNKANDDSDGLYESLQIVSNDNFDYRSSDGQARMVALMGIAAAKNDTLAQTMLTDAYNKQGTDLGRALQARKLFLLMTPEGRKASLERMAKNVENEFLKKGYTKNITFSKWVMDAAAAARTEEEFSRIRYIAAGEIAEQMPSNWKEKLQGWRMLAMLGNPRTHIRNILGNLCFTPAVAIKNKIGALGEIVSRQEERTKTLGFASQEARSFAKNDAEYMKDILTGEAKYNELNPVQQQRKTWGQGTGLISRTLGKATQALSDFSGGMLEKEDWIFLQRHYRNALAGYMTANHLTTADMNGTTLINARAYAVQEAQKATYRDASKLATTLSKIGRDGGVAGFFVNAALPFKKTPINILKRGIEYSPAGLLKALSADAYHLKQWNDWSSGKYTVLPEKAISPTQWIDRLASGLTGTGILALGAALCKAGIVSAGFGDDDDEFDKLEGDQEYSLKLHILGQDYSYTIDWAAPSCMPFFVGATIAKTFGKDIEMDKLADALLGITEPVFNLSMLEGVNSLLDVNNYAEGNAITQIMEKVLTNYASSFVPTVVGQIARSIDTTRRKSYVESGASLATPRYAIEQLENKIPYLSKTNIPYRNAWGEADVSNPVWAVIENFISPGYGGTVEQDAVTEELRRLYQASNDKGMIPKMPGKTLTVNKETVKLNAEQYDQLTVERGQTAKNTLEAMMNTPEWQIADDQTKADMVNDVWKYANQVANSKIDSGANKDTWVSTAEKKGNAVDAIIGRAIERNQKEYVDGHKQSMLDALEAGDIDTALTDIEALREADKSDTSIKSYITNHFKPLWQEAIEDDRDDDALEIENNLDELGEFIFNYGKWEVSDEEDEEPEETNTDWLKKQ